MVIAVAIMLGAGIVTEILAVLKAPLGYQDDKGFHVGSEHSCDEDTTLMINQR
jgi:hypothetical protein